MYSQEELVTPAHARAILDHKNPRNRPVNRALVRRKLDDMQRGDYILNPQGISFDHDGNLLDGQHTLIAITEFGHPITLYVHHDVPPEAQRVMDQTLVRTAAQVLALETALKGASYYTAAARAVLEHGLGMKPTNAAVVAWARANAETLETYLTIGKKLTAGTHAAFAFAEIQGWKHVQRAAERLISLDWDGSDDPMKALKRALDDMGGRDGAKSKRARFFTALNALQAVSEDRGLSIAKKCDSMPARVRESILPAVAA